MVARYKKKRLAEGMALDGTAKCLRLEGSERQRARSEVREELKNQHINTDFIIREEARMEREEAMAWACYQRELDDPNYRCTCPDPWAQDED